MLFFSQNWTKCPGQDLEVGIRNADLKSFPIFKKDTIIRGPLQTSLYQKSLQTICIRFATSEVGDLPFSRSETLHTSRAIMRKQILCPRRG